MAESGYYPPGAEFDPRAPYNEPVPIPVKVDVTVSITLSKTFTIEVEDYDYDGWGDIDVSRSDLKGAAENQIVFPYEIAKVIENFIKARYINVVDQKSTITKALEQAKDWDLDDFEVIKE